jgi:hypothetical protein
MEIIQLLQQMREADKRTEALNQKPQKTDLEIKRAYIGSLTGRRK